MTMPTSWKRLMPAAAALAILTACAGTPAGGAATRQFDVEAFLRAPDTTLSEVLTNADFLSATRMSANDCAAMLQSAQTGVLEDLPGTARGHAWLRRATANPDEAWLVVSRHGGERTCHGPLPYETMHGLATRSGA